MKENKHSITTKGWLIIGILLIIIGTTFIYIANSLHSEYNQLNQEATREIAINISMEALYIGIASIIIIVIGTIMCIEWYMFSKLIKKYAE